MFAMDDTHKIGQRLVAGFPGPEMSQEFIDLVRKYKVGNVILFRWNVVDREQLRRLCQEIQSLVQQETGVPAFITIDQEGGAVTRLSDDALNIPGAMALSATGDAGNVRQAGRITGQELRELGINFNLAPDMDVNSNANNPVIGVRSYSDDPEIVAAMGIEMMRGLLDENVLCCAKHFPGHGDTDVDSHLGLPRVDKSLEQLQKNELHPFIRAIEAGIPGIMSSHILFPQLEPDGLPATMSRRIMTGLLREKLGFKGLVVSDCMQMQAIQKYYGTVKGVCSAVLAGVDLVFVSHDASLAGQAAQQLMEDLHSGALNREELDASVNRILAYKEKYALAPLPMEREGREEKHKEIARLMDLGITAVNQGGAKLPALGESPLFVSCRPYRATEASNLAEEEFSFAEYLAQKLGGQAIVIDADPSREQQAQVLEKAAQSSCLVFGSYNGHLKAGQMELARSMAQTHAPMIQVALRNPYDLKDMLPHVYGLAVYEYSMRSLRAVERVLRGEFVPAGKLPVKL